MKYAYFIDTQKGEDERKNQEVFLLIQKYEIPEENVFAEENPKSRVEFSKLLDELKENDTLIIRSIMDMEDELQVLQEDILPYLSDLNIQILSCQEPYLCGVSYADTLNNIVNLISYYNRKRRSQGYQKALREKRVGRPSKSEDIEKALKLYQSGNYSVSEVESMTGICKSTLYKYLKEQKVCI